MFNLCNFHCSFHIFRICALSFLLNGNLTQNSLHQEFQSQSQCSLFLFEDFFLPPSLDGRIEEMHHPIVSIPTWEFIQVAITDFASHSDKTNSVLQNLCYGSVAYSANKLSEPIFNKAFSITIWHYSGFTFS